MLFVLIAIDKPGHAQLRADTRAAHLDYLRETGAAKLGGPFLNGDGGMAGSLLILDVAGRQAAQAWAKNDPYAKAGLFASVDIRDWRATVNNCGAEF